MNRNVNLLLAAVLLLVMPLFVGAVLFTDLFSRKVDGGAEPAPRRMELIEHGRFDQGITTMSYFLVRDRETGQEFFITNNGHPIALPLKK